MKQQEIYTDTLYSQGSTYLWEVTSRQSNDKYLVKSDTASHACDYICATKWISRLHLTARIKEKD